jgi:DNA polymerase-3 subunit chi
MTGDCQIDFYVLKSPGLDVRRLACKLALMAWERGHHISVLAETEAEAADLNELMWATPAERFLPHEIQASAGTRQAPVSIGLMAGLNEADVVINLGQQPVPEPGRYSRLLEIVPPQGPGLEASRDKFRYYRDQGITPKMHEINQ